MPTKTQNTRFSSLCLVDLNRNLNFVIIDSESIRKRDCRSFSSPCINFIIILILGGMCEPGDGFLENLKQPGRMTGRLPVVEGVPMIQANTLFICFPESP